MKTDKFCAFILTHGRPDRVYTLKTLQKSGYTGPVYLVVDDEDEARGEYVARYGDRVLMFSKREIAATFDEGDNFKDRRTIIYARNACFELAKKVGCTYFMQLDDDYTNINYKFNSALEAGEWQVKDLDSVLDSLLDYYRATPALSIAMAQNGDFLGGNKCTTFAKRIRPMRKCMNTFICSTERPFQFVGRINEDVNTYTALARRGALFLTVPNVSIIQKQTQSNAGGMTELYRDSGTYVKSFYSVMYAPSCVKIGEMGHTHKRLHHRVVWRNTCAMIIEARHRKTLEGAHG